LRVGLTGGLACGKSTVGAMMVAHGAHLIQADTIAHELMRPGQPVYDEVVRHFGTEIVQSDGTIDRAKLAQLAFGWGRIQELNRIVHPAVIQYQQEWMAKLEQQYPGSIVVVEAALIFEAGVNNRFDKLVVVTCTPVQKIERYVGRVTQRENTDAAIARAEAERRLTAQLPDDEKVKAADFVIDNSGDLVATEAQVKALMQNLRAASAASKQ
jgi:dephospho-CoA kinase